MNDLVLIIDPDQIERRYIAAILAAEGFDVTQIATPIEGIVEAMERGEDVSIIVLTEETGPVQPDEVIELIRRVTTTPVIVIGGGGQLIELALLARGGDYYVKRPFAASGLISRIHMLIRRAGGSTSGESFASEAGESAKRPTEFRLFQEGPAWGKLSV